MPDDRRQSAQAGALARPLKELQDEIDAVRDSLTDDISVVRGALVEHERACVAAFADIRGEKGNNGKLGELRRRVDGHGSRAWWLTTAMIGLASTAAIKLVAVVTAFNALAATAAQSRDEIRLLQAQVQTLQSALLVRNSVPAPEPGKDSQP